MEPIVDSEPQPLGQFDFEKNFSDREARKWMQDNWDKSLFVVAAYVILIFGIQHFMKGLRGYSLRVPLTLWSLSLALFSVTAACRFWKLMIFILSTKGFKQSVCSQSFYNQPISRLWGYIFLLSKFLELGDTLFIVLRKKKLIFLHWYHHTIALLVTWYAYNSMVPGGGWLTALNLSVHAIMYSYYTVRAAGFQLPRLFSVTITLTQILQIMAYVVMNILTIFWMEDKVCHTTWTMLCLSSVTYISVLVLLCNFFFKTYLRSTLKSKGE